jgi:glycosyltransferase involved in cell wall biosynthesis
MLRRVNTNLPKATTWMTVVIPSYNQAAYLKLTLDSVKTNIADLQSKYPKIGVDVWVQDGGSNDGSVQILEQAKARGELNFVSGKDGGQSDAIDVAIRQHATGEWVGWLNSDDVWKTGTLLRMYELIRANPENDWLTGSVDIIDGEGHAMRSWVSFYKRWGMSQLSFSRLLHENLICQMGTFFKRSAYLEVGGLRKDLRYCMDYDLWLKLYAKFGKPLGVKPSSKPLASFRMVKGTKSMDGFERQFQEELEVALSHAAMAKQKNDSKLGNIPSENSLRWPRKRTTMIYRVLRKLGM